jgi:hypothetical protein
MVRRVLQPSLSMLRAGHLLSLAILPLLGGSCRRSTSTAEQALEATDAGAAAGRGTTVWSRVFRAGNEGEAPDPGALVPGPAGDLWMAGVFTSPMVLLGETVLSDASDGNVFVARLDPTGAPRWVARAGCSGFVGLSVGAGGEALVTCGSTTTAHLVGLVKLDASGARLWQKDVVTILEPEPTWIRDAAPDGAGGVLLLGTTEQAIRVGSSIVRGGCFVARVDASGEEQWATRVGITSQREGFRIAVDGTGQAVVGEGSADGLSIFLAKVDTSGNQLWGRYLPRHAEFVTFVGLGADARGDILLSGVGGIHVPGEGLIGTREREPWIAKLDPSRHPLWQSLGVAGRVVADADSNVLFVGDDVVGKLGAASGARLWQWSPEVTGTARIGAAAVDGVGRLIVAGRLSGSVDLGNGPLDCGPGRALFLVALAP